jgi:methyl-accepting chemotaxis protein
MLGDIQRATNSAVMVTEEGAKRADSAVKQAEQAGQNIGELTQVIQTTAQAARQIATSSRQQALGIDQIVLAFRHINEATGDTVSGARQTESSAGDLKHLSDKMRDLVAPYGL